MSRFFPYPASKPAAIAVAILFLISLILHIYQASRARARYMLVLIIATIMQVLGYATRYLAIVKDPSLPLYVSSQAFIVTAPALLAAQDYMVVGRMMSYVGPESSPISHSVITKLFVFIDIVCVIGQSTGISLFSMDFSNRDRVALGRTILLVGLIAQIISFLVFILVTIIFDVRSRRIKGSEIQRLRGLFIVFYLSGLMIIGRSVYRAIEFGTVNFTSQVQGYLYDNEWPYYVLDSIPILIATVAFNIVNPVNILPRKKGLRMDGTVEKQRKHWWSSAEDAQASQDLLMSKNYP
ncbi:hypothetical protein CPB86DRAFT_69939 [Serendipita vermifera]|nr:hypothetical protein CPB86DRAFT_69939 [Serendipita vermifera]